MDACTGPPPVGFPGVEGSRDECWGGTYSHGCECTSGEAMLTGRQESWWKAFPKPAETVTAFEYTCCDGGDTVGVYCGTSHLATATQLRAALACC